tara:strand:+ start:294 stop:533 length:240 start_codon:yes stop_codon:yes gene_type:complete
MKHKTTPLLLVNKIEEATIYDAPEPAALIKRQQEATDRYPFPLSRTQQFELLYLLRTRKSGIITREELQSIIFPAPTLH